MNLTIRNFKAFNILSSFYAVKYLLTTCDIFCFCTFKPYTPVIIDNAIVTLMHWWLWRFVFLTHDSAFLSGLQHMTKRGEDPFKEMENAESMYLADRDRNDVAGPESYHQFV